MTPRERVLAMVVGSMLPVFIVFAFGYWFYTSYEGRRQKISSLRNQIRNEEDIQAAYMKAGDRRHQYKQISLPANMSVAKTDYKDWLSRTTEAKLRFDKPINVAPLGNAVPVKYQGQSTVFNQLKFQVSGITTLDKYLDFMYDFHRLDLLHRVSSFSIRPVDRKRAGGGMERTDEIVISLKIEVISIEGADEQRDAFSSSRPVLAKNLDEYKKEILFRDIFGPANNRPDITTTTTQRFTEGDPVAIRVVGKDKDKGDKLTYEITKKDEELKDLAMRTSSSGAQLSIDDLPVGRYAFTMQVTDDGCPAKSFSKDFVIRVEKKKVTDPGPKITKKPKFQHAKAAHITAILRDAKGQTQVWINARTLKKFYELTVGDTFRMDDFEWEVKSIDVEKQKVVVSRDDQTFEYGHSDFLFRDLPKEVKTSGKQKTNGGDDK